MATKSAVRSEGEPITVDPNLLFQRLVKVAQVNPDQLPSCFEYELTNSPTALFDTCGLPREARKGELAKFLFKATKQESAHVLPEKGLQHVLDGGALLHRLPWTRSSTYAQVIGSYVDFVQRHYGHAVVVFDGYGQGHSTKDVTHLRRRSGRQTSCDIVFEPDMLVTESRESFLSNESNKRFIEALAGALQDEEISAIEAAGDADCSTILLLSLVKHL